MTKSFIIGALVAMVVMLVITIILDVLGFFNPFVSVMIGLLVYLWVNHEEYEEDR